MHTIAIANSVYTQFQPLDFLKFVFLSYIYEFTFTAISISSDYLFLKIAIFFAQNLRYFRAKFFLRTFAQFLRMKRNEFCAILRDLFCANCAKPEIFFCEFLRTKRKEFYAIFLRKTESITQNVTF